MGTIEKHQFKITIGVAIVVLLSIITLTSQFSTWKAEIEANCREFDDRITHVGEKVVDMRADISTLEDSANLRDVQLAMINTKLANIETLLIEIKQDMKDDRKVI